VTQKRHSRKRSPSLAETGLRSDRVDVPSSAEFCSRLREHLTAELNKPYAQDASMTNFQALSEKLVQMAVGGSKDAIHVVLDRLAGRAPQAATVDSDDGPVHIEYVIGIPRPNHEDKKDSTPDGGLPAVRQAG
jgi:hypothetical protein